MLLGQLFPCEHLALQRRVPGILHLSPLLHCEQCLLYLFLGNSSIQPTLPEGISLFQLASGATSQPLARFEARVHRRSSADVNLATISIKAYTAEKRRQSRPSGIYIGRPLMYRPTEIPHPQPVEIQAPGV